MRSSSPTTVVEAKKQGTTTEIREIAKPAARRDSIASRCVKRPRATAAAALLTALGVAAAVVAVTVDWTDGAAAATTTAAAPNTTCGGADLLVEEATLRASVRTEWLLNLDPCAVDESCFAGLGNRRVLRFSTLVANIGCQDYIVGAPASGAGWSWHACHQHWHYINYAQYQLQPLCGDSDPVAGHKNGWCVFDAGVYGPPAGQTCGRGSVGCLNTQFSQGISAGCYDVYPANLQCQWGAHGEFELSGGT